MQQKVSIIVTIFNKEDTIQKCLKSIQEQSFKEIEVLVIDDGSTDGSSMIAQKICSEDHRFHYYYQSNQGVSSARNLGLKNAEGEYLFFVDGDDFIDNDYIAQFMHYHDYDLVIGGYKKIDKNNLVINTAKPQSNRILFQSLNIFCNEDAFKFIGIPVAKLYKLSIIKRNNLEFDVERDFGEDTIFVFEYLLKCQKVRYISYSGYDNNIYLPNTLSRRIRSNIWEVNRNLVTSLEEKIDCTCIKCSTFLFMRAVSLSLRSCVNDYKLFNKTWAKIRKDQRIKSVRFKDISTRGKKLIYLLIRLNAKRLAYSLYKKKVNESN